MIRHEEQLHRSVASYLRVAAPSLLWWSTPNQRGTRSRFEMGILQALGVRAGVPDICMVLPGGQFASIELKSTKGRVNAAQAIFRDASRTSGARYDVCRSLDEVIAVLRSWNVPLRSREAA